MKLETRPPKYGKYLITHKDGKIHWETWNGSGWAYNHNEIRYWVKFIEVTNVDEPHFADLKRKYRKMERRPNIVCMDGFSMSVQASEYTYCYPRENRLELTHTNTMHMVGYIHIYQ